MSGGLEIARRALQTNSYIMDTIGNNIANVNTEGYSRQVVRTKPTDSISIAADSQVNPFASLGTGVSAYAIERVRNEFFDNQMRNILDDYGSWEQQSITYSNVESIFNEPSDVGISANLDAFWNSWYSVQLPDPADSGARANVLASAEQLTQSLSFTRSALTNLKVNLDDSISFKLEEANGLIQSISKLNTQIIEAEASGGTTSLRDQRNVQVNELVQLIDASYYEDDRGGVTIAFGGLILVSEQEVSLLEAKYTTSSGETKTSIFLEGSVREIEVTGGEVYGIVQSRDQIVDGYIGQLDELAMAVKDSVNSVHRDGYDLLGNKGINIFEGTNAYDLSVNDLLARDPSLLAASTSPNNVEGNGENALAISNLRDLGVFDSGTTSINEYYQNLISDLGVNSLAAQNYVKTNEDIKKQITNQIAEVSGVSIDEEMADMIRYQNAYQAIAKYLGVVQEMLDVLTNMV